MRSDATWCRGARECVRATPGASLLLDWSSMIDASKKLGEYCDCAHKITTISFGTPSTACLKLVPCHSLNHPPHWLPRSPPLSASRLSRLSLPRFRGRASSPLRAPVLRISCLPSVLSAEPSRPVLHEALRFRAITTRPQITLPAGVWYLIHPKPVDWTHAVLGNRNSVNVVVRSFSNLSRTSAYTRARQPVSLVSLASLVYLYHDGAIAIHPACLAASSLSQLQRLIRPGQRSFCARKKSTMSSEARQKASSVL